MKCLYGCGRDVDPNARDSYRQIVGLERKTPKNSSRRGGSDIVLRKSTGEYACEICVTRVKSGLSPQQESLM